MLERGLQNIRHKILPKDTSFRAEETLITRGPLIHCIVWQFVAAAAAAGGVSLRVLGLPSAGRWIRQEGDRILLLDIAPFVTSTFSMEIKLYISLCKFHI
jgi:hypothetical protein